MCDNKPASIPRASSLLAGTLDHDAAGTPKSARHFHESPTFRFVSSPTAVDGIHRRNPKIDAEHSRMVDYPGLSRSLPRRNLDCVTLNSGQHTAEDDSMKG
jgi:hypothetical protein